MQTHSSTFRKRDITITALLSKSVSVHCGVIVKVYCIYCCAERNSKCLLKLQWLQSVSLMNGQHVYMRCRGYYEVIDSPENYARLKRCLCVCDLLLSRAMINDGLAITIVICMHGFA